MTPVVAFVLASTFLFLWLSLVWSSKSSIDLFIKMCFIIMTLWGALHLLGHIAPYINSGQMRIL